MSGDTVKDRDGLGDSDCVCVCSGASAERVGLGNARVGDGDARVGDGGASVGDSDAVTDAVTDGRSTAPCPSFPPHADNRPSARTHRTA